MLLHKIFERKVVECCGNKVAIICNNNNNNNNNKMMATNVVEPSSNRRCHNMTTPAIATATTITTTSTPSTITSTTTATTATTTTSTSATISYYQLNEKANKVARFIVRETRRRRLPPNADGDYVVAVCMQPSAELVAVLLAIWKAGAAYLPIDPSFPLNRVRHIEDEAQPIMLLHDGVVGDVGNVGEHHFHECRTQRFDVDDVIEQAAALDGSDIINVTETLLDGGVGRRGSSQQQPTIATILYTSGSTGIPKGVRLTHDVILNRLQWQWTTFPYARTENVGIFKTALTFVDSIAELWSPLLSGLTVIVATKAVTKDPARLVQMLDQYEIHRLVLVPTLLRSLLMYLKLGDMEADMEQQRRPLTSVKMWVCSGEPLPVALALDFFDYFEEGVHKLYNFYGSTEVMGDVTYFTCETKKQLHQYDRVPIGLPIANTVIYLLDEELRPVKGGDVGELYVAGLNLAKGYVNGRDTERFRDNPLAVELKYSRIYRTGDYGSLRDGQLMYEGRTDSQIKVRGHRVDLSEVEKIAGELPLVERAIVLCYHGGQLDQTLLAFVELRADAPLCSELQLEAMLRGRQLADYMTPQIRIVDRMPLLVNGKIDRQALIKSYETANNNDDDTSIVLDYDYDGIAVEQRTIARDLFETVGHVIGRSMRTTVTARSNFYELGGNSLNSIFTVSLLREKGYSVAISEFIAARNLGEILAKMMMDNDRGDIDDGSCRDDDWRMACPHLDMEAIPLRMHDKGDVIDIIVDSFYGKADLEQWLKPHIYRHDYRDIINDIWLPLLQKELSFIVRDRKTGRTIGTALNFDAVDEPPVEVNSKLTYVFDFLEFVEGPIRDTHLPKGFNKILHSFMMGTQSYLNAQENIACMHFMEHGVLQLAKRRHFAGILTTNTNPLTQQLGSDVYKYRCLLDYQVNEYVHSDGTKPFGMAPATQRAIVHWKEITGDDE